LHGVPPNGLDSSIWKLLLHGVEKSNSVFEKAAYALLHPKSNEPYKRTFPGGPALDSDGRGGDRSVAANILASLGRDSEVESSLQHFSAVLNCTSVDDFSKTTRTGSRRYYKPNALFPGANHIRLLGATKGWRTEKNTEMVKDSFRKCFEIMGNERNIINFKRNSHFIGPFNFKMDYVSVFH
jgi:hypothetical protein